MKNKKLTILLLQSCNGVYNVSCITFIPFISF